jgi:cytochrome c-type biogenesis protein CcmF
MIANLGFGFLFIAFLISLYALVTAAYGLRSHSAPFVESARLAAIVTFPIISLSILSLIALLLTDQFQYTYVFRVISADMSLILKLTALWGGQAGSLLFWVWLLAGVTAVNFLWSKQKELNTYTPWVIIITMTMLAFFLFMVLFFENPFERIWLSTNGQVLTSFIQPAGTYPVFPKAGMGLNPLLRNIGMALHPPLLYLGFVTFLIPFAYAFAGLAGGHENQGWLRQTRLWMLAGWIFLSGGLVLGSRWSYDVLGWGGYWGWDAVEIAAFMPWLTSTAFLHSVIVQERRNLFKRWNYVLLLLTFCLVLLGTFLTRSGVVSSVHAFSESSIGPFFFVLIGLTFFASLGLILWRWNGLAGSGEIHSFFSRESFILFANVLLVCIFLICLTGVLFPIVSEVLTGQEVTVGAQWYKTTTGPLFALLLLLMGVVPLSGWGATTARRLQRSIWKPALGSLIVPAVLLIMGKRSWGGILALWLAGLFAAITIYDYSRTLKAQPKPLAGAFLHLVSSSHQRLGGNLVHLGIVLMAVGIIGIEFFQVQTQATLTQGTDFAFHGFTLRYQDLQSTTPLDGRETTSAVIKVQTPAGKTLTITPRSDYYAVQQQSVTVPGEWNTVKGDLYIVLVDWQPLSASSATFRIYWNPLIFWLWAGAVVLILGGLIAFWPDRKQPMKEPVL